ncbi:MAG: ATP:cob(I)alamin adenosyltransferase [Gammaproteobacteria bacterium]|nr:MAG: ATP:cob(I)alamin adenosyltransferase [Gammaproteobacteria bacterium]PIE37881.1 MAG: ATP:cob(I)alamin adenosyltransferase [Gammaproteobacteria bacterium]
MGHRLSRIYTRTGDKGDTGLGDGTRTPKDNIRVAAYGTTDELNSILGMLLAESVPEDVARVLHEVQHHLFDLGGELCIPGHQAIREEHVTWLEEVLDHFNEDLPRLKEFILPGGGRAAGICHFARTVCRRAEREVVTLGRDEALPPFSLGYLNRLSDLLFVIARVLARFESGAEVLWQRDRESISLGKSGDSDKSHKSDKSDDSSKSEPTG